jgi:hypothetical protein
MSNDESKDEVELRLDFELLLLRRINEAFSSSLHMLEAANKSLDVMGKRLDELTATSQLLRQALNEKRKQDAKADGSHVNSP